MEPSATLLAHRDGLPDFGPLSVFTEARPALVPILLVAVPAVLYLLGVRRLRSRGDAWPVGRT
ncbi:MAG: cytochrome c oxidase assembly protein, partial [Actinomycetota bacterium]|nr:cytochrome c oxidase assembly protein [Actinomycetota bacterium]